MPTLRSHDQPSFTRKTPHPKQQQVWDIIAAAPSGSISLIGYGGAAGGGKTFTISELAQDLAIDFPGNRILVGRKDFKDLNETTLLEFQTNAAKPLIVARNNNEHWYDIRLSDWPDGVASRIYFRELKDWQGLGSTQYGAVLIDEAGEVPANAARMLLGRLRHQLPDIIRDTERTAETPWGRKNLPCDHCNATGKLHDGGDCRYCEGQGKFERGKPIKAVFLAASNPYPGWFEEWFVRRNLDEDLMRQYSLTVNFVPSLPSDNPSLPTDYEARLRLVWPADWVRRMMEGRWDAFEGQVYPMFNPGVHAWQGELPGPEHWDKVVGGLDFGGQNPYAHFSAGMVAILLKSNRLIRVAEFEERGPNIYDRHIQWMARQEEEWCRNHERHLSQRRIQWVADRTQGVATHYWKTQLGFRVRESWGARDSRNYGIAMVGRRLETDPTGLPGSFYHHTLRIFPERMLAYRYEEPANDDSSVKPIPVRRGDDLLDADRYMHEAIDRPDGAPQPNQIPFVINTPTSPYRRVLDATQIVGARR